jgi:hypothetical protein
MTTFGETTTEVIFDTSIFTSDIEDAVENPLGVTFNSNIEHIEWEKIDDGDSIDIISKFGSTYSEVEGWFVI